MIRLFSFIAILGIANALHAECRQETSDLIYNGWSGSAELGRMSLRLTPNEATVENGRRLTITGTYSSGDRFGVEGLAVQNGEIISNRLQSWDGVLLIDDAGHPYIRYAEKINYDGAQYNLRDRGERTELLEKLNKERVSLIQSHLLINDFSVDVRDIEDAPKFRRRVLIQGEKGQFAVYDSGDCAVTLYEVTLEIQEKYAPQYALNLDMGAYNYCRITTPQKEENCGLLWDQATDRLTNLIEITTQPLK